MRSFQFHLIIAICLTSSSWGMAGQDTGNDQTVPVFESFKTPPKSSSYLGVNVGDVHPAVASHLPGVGATGQGILVESVSPNSPATAAGIRDLDILMAYDDQKLFSRNQLVKLVAMNQPGDEVAIRLIRDGKQEVKKVRLGQRPSNMAAPRLQDEPAPRSFPQFDAPQWLTQKPQRHAPPTVDRPTWHRIESLAIKRLENDDFRITLTHFDEGGKRIKHEYTGTRDELRKRIDADVDLKPNERVHLLRSLDISDDSDPWALLPDEQDPES